MIENILYILYTEGENEWKEINNNRFRIVIAKYNPKSTSIFLGRRFNIVYCDAEFTKSAWGREAIAERFKPCANIGKAEFYLI